MKKVNFIRILSNINCITFLILSVNCVDTLHKSVKNKIPLPKEGLTINKSSPDTIIKKETLGKELEPQYLKPFEWQGLFFVVLEKADFLRSSGYNLYLCKKEKWKTTTPDLDWGLENHRVRVEKIAGDTVLVEEVVPDTNSEWEVTFLHLPTNRKIYGYTYKQAISEIVLLKDIEKAEQRWKDKFVFSKRGIISILEKKETFSLSTRKIKLSDSLIVKGVRAGVCPLPVKPIWVIVATKDGTEGIIPIRYSWTNTMIDQIKEEQPWEEDIFEADPLSIYKWDKGIWELIDNHRVIIGMTEEQVRLSWGSPDSISTDEKDKNITKIWHYPSHFVLFSNDKVFSIKEKKIEKLE
ncbi:MAG: hypothetical protein N2053_12075 [Chitinispirillaceae bacterium]|nr:hypothetical protein [Chitinispirillaceae bacterium]